MCDTTQIPERHLNDKLLAYLLLRVARFLVLQGSVSWSSAPSLMPLPDGAKVSTISQNPINYAAEPQPAVVGHISVAGGSKAQSKRIDVSEAVTRLNNLFVSVYRRY